MADSQAGRRVHTLSEIAQRTGISMPTLQRYKKLYQSRIPSVGKGRKQRYPDEALPVFEQLKVENAGRRGRPRKNAAAPRAMASGTRGAVSGVKRGPGRPRKTAAPPAPAAKRRGRPPGRKAAAAPAAVSRGSLMTLTEIGEQTGISYPTLVRYVKLYGNRLPSEGKGRTRRYYPEAVDVFRELRAQSGRGGRKPGPGKRLGRPPGRRGRPPASGADAGTAHRLKALEKAQQELEKRFRGFAQSLQKLFR